MKCEMSAFFNYVTQSEQSNSSFEEKELLQYIVVPSCYEMHPAIALNCWGIINTHTAIKETPLLLTWNETNPFIARGH